MANVLVTGESTAGGVIAADMAKVSQSVNQVSKAGAEASSGGLNMLNKAMGLLGAAGSLAGIAAATAQLYELGAAAEEAGGTLNALTGGGADDYINAIRDSSDGMISKFDAATISNKALNAGFFTSAEQIGNVTNAAAMLADVMGVDTVQATNLLIDAIDKGNMRMLAQAGIVMKGADAQAAINALMAADPRLDATTAAQLAAYNAVLQRSNELEALGVGAKRGAGDSAERLTASIDNLTSVMGGWVSQALQPAADGATNLVQGVVDVNEAIADQRQYLMDNTDSFSEFLDIAKVTPGVSDEIITGVRGVGSNLADLKAEWEANHAAITAATAAQVRSTEASRNDTGVQIVHQAAVDGMIERTNALNDAINQHNAEVEQQASVTLSLLQNQDQLTDAWVSGQNALANSNLTAMQQLEIYQALGLATGNLTAADIAYANTRREVDNLLTSGLLTAQQYMQAIDGINAGTSAAAVSSQAHNAAVNDLASTLMSQGIPLMQAYKQAQEEVNRSEEGTTQTAAQLKTMIDEYNTALSQMNQPSLIQFREQGGQQLVDLASSARDIIPTIPPAHDTNFTDNAPAAAMRAVSVKTAIDDIPKYTQIVIDIVTNGSVPSVSGGGGTASSGGGWSGGVVNGYAGGTLNFPGGIGMVGEQGRELVRLPTGTRIHSNSETEAMLDNLLNGRSGGAQGPSVTNYNTYNVTIVAQPGDQLRDLMEQARQLQGDA